MNDLNMGCPQCGHSESFHISCYTIARIDEEGVQDHGDMEYDSSSACSCPQCGHCATVIDFEAGADQ